MKDSSGDSITRIMWLTVISLIPAGAAGVFIFGSGVITIIALAVISALLTELILNILSRRKITIIDGSAAVTGILLAYNLPPRVPFWLPVIGSFVAISIGKHIFGGLGQNIFNPALIGRVFLMASWPKYMTTWINPRWQVDAITQATPLAMLKEGKLAEKFSGMDLFLGNRPGCIGEVCILALLLGAAFLLWRGYISWHIPVVYIATVGIFTYTFSPAGIFHGEWLVHILGGGLILGAFFMATDYVTSPASRKGKLIFALGCGLLTAIIRLWGRYPEGVSYAILLMNAAVPAIKRYTN